MKDHHIYSFSLSSENGSIMFYERVNEAVANSTHLSMLFASSYRSLYASRSCSDASLVQSSSLSSSRAPGLETIKMQNTNDVLLWEEISNLWRIYEWILQRNIQVIIFLKFKRKIFS